MKVTDMVDHNEVRRIRSSMNQLLDELSPHWPADMVRLMREEVGYGEYSDALQNLIAIAVRGHIEVTDAQYEKVKQLVYEMNIVPEVIKMILDIKHNERDFLARQAG